MLVKPRLEIEGRRYVVIAESEYERLCRNNGQALEPDDLPDLPKPDRNGRYPAVEYACVALARDLLRDADARMGRLVAHLKHQRRQSRVLRSAMDSLRGLPELVH